VRTQGQLLLIVLALDGCAASAPSSKEEAYVRALTSGHLETAYALTTSAFRAEVTEADFRRRFSDEATRKAHAAAIEEGLARAAPELFAAAPADVPANVVLRFSSAVHEGHFEDAWRCLSAALRARYSVEALARDFAAEPSAAARLERAALAAEGSGVTEGSTVRFPVPGGGAVSVVRESDGWRLAALE
jgi:hypothetical protein